MANKEVALLTILRRHSRAAHDTGDYIKRDLVDELIPRLQKIQKQDKRKLTKIGINGIVNHQINELQKIYDTYLKLELSAKNEHELEGKAGSEEYTIYNYTIRKTKREIDALKSLLFEITEEDIAQLRNELIAAMNLEDKDKEKLVKAFS